MRTLFLFLFFIGSLLLVSAQPLSPTKKQAFIDRHNYWRAMVRAPDVIWSDALAAAAQKYANYLAMKCNVLKHSRNDDYGENLYWGTRDNPVEIIDLWASEKIYYHKDKITERGAEKYGHYTQLIWPQTTEIGCAFAQCRKGYYYFCVCKYNPAGNYIGVRALK